jgi:hypothetical protein
MQPPELTEGDIALGHGLQQGPSVSDHQSDGRRQSTNVVHSNSGAFVPGNAISSWDPNDKNQIIGPGSELMSFRSSTYYLAIDPDSGAPGALPQINTQERSAAG